MSLEEAIAKARLELGRLKAEEEELRQKAGVNSTILALTDVTRRLSEERTEIRERIEKLKTDLVASREHKAELELQLKGARARVLKLKERR